jgi:hypothetical protein
MQFLPVLQDLICILAIRITAAILRREFVKLFFQLHQKPIEKMNRHCGHSEAMKLNSFAEINLSRLRRDSFSLNCS